MNKYDLSILIPARNEMFVAKTIENIIQNKRGKTEVLVGLDGEWANPQILEHEDVTILYSPVSLGQRGMTNQLCRLSNAKYVMKLDAHCVLDEGFDLKMIAEMQDDYTMIPSMYNLHAFDWVCIGKTAKSGKLYVEDAEIKKLGCGNTIYQGPTPAKCEKCQGNMERLLIFKPRLSKKSNYYRFDKTLHFYYWGAYGERPEAQADVAPIMSAQGSCFMLTRKKYWELDICDELHGSWGQQGVEVAMKTWLSGGRLMVNKKTWYSHMFRTQGGDFGFPYPISGNDVDKARKYSRWLWVDGNWKPAKHDLNWLLEKFSPVPDWHDKVQKGIVFYTDNRVNLRIAHKVQSNLRKTGISIVSASLKPMVHFGENIHIQRERGYLTMFKQQLAALEASKADIIYMCEHDVLYHPSHFDFIPPLKDVFYYNTNVWKVDSKTGFSLWVDVCQQVSGLVAYRELLIEEYKRRISRVEKEGKFERGWGFEPGTKSIGRGGFSDHKAENFKSKYPNIDIRADHNMTKNRWKKEEFRNQRNTVGWTEANMSRFLKDGWTIEQINFLPLV